MTFQYPLAFLLLLPLVVWGWLRFRQRPVSIEFSSGHLLEKLPKQIPWPRYILIAIHIIALTLLIIALARPRVAMVHEKRSVDMVDMVMILDTSGSMKAEDFKPSNRLVVAKEVVAEFVKARKDDRLGLVVFSGETLTKCPLTLDHEILLSLLNRVDFGQLEDGTAIGDAIATALNRLKGTEAKSKIIILLTDGENNRGEIDPVTAANLAKAIGVKIYTIGVGKEGGAPMPIGVSNGQVVYARYPDGTLFLTKLDEATLLKIAAITNGKYFRARSAKSLKDIYTSIDQLEKTRIEASTITRYEEKYPALVWLAMILLLIEHLAGKTIWRELA